MQSDGMNSNWAEENLQTIRTLMERSAIYRRALAPIMLLAGTLGLIAAAIGILLPCDSFPKFLTLWFGTVALAIVGAFLIARRQALKDQEPFWSPPTRRVAHALLPPLLSGMFWGIFAALLDLPFEAAFLVALAWILFYGLALHAAGFFISRGVRWFGWIYVASVPCIMTFLLIAEPENLNANWLMGFFFGVLHLAYGAYLYLTERGKNAT